MDYKVTRKARLVEKVTGRLTSFIRIGDEMYFEEIAAGSSNKHLKELVLDTETHASNRECYIVVDTNEISFGNDSEDVIVANDATIVLLKKGLSITEWLTIHDEDKTFAYKEKKNLGCDTASFIVATESASDGITIHTGADGYYGLAYVWKNTLGMEITLAFSDDWYTDGGSIETPEEIVAFLSCVLAKQKK